MLPSRVAGEVAKGRATEGWAAAQAAAEGDWPPTALLFTALVPFTALVAWRGKLKAEAERRVERRTVAASFMAEGG
jgi:hypothetical protein